MPLDVNAVQQALKRNEVTELGKIRPQSFQKDFIYILTFAHYVSWSQREEMFAGLQQF